MGLKEISRQVKPTDSMFVSTQKEMIPISLFLFLFISLCGSGSDDPNTQNPDHCPKTLQNIPLKDEVRELLNGKGISLLTEPLPLDPTLSGPIFSEIFKELDRIIVGHDLVKERLASAVQRGAMTSSNRARPIAAFLLLGITGTGKTLIGTTLAEILTGRKNSAIILRGGELQEDHEIAKLTGSPPGYVGHNDTFPILSNERLENNTGDLGINIVVIDELEKASPALIKLLLGIMEEGQMTTGKNTLIDFSRTIFILTSNIGQERLIYNSTGDKTQDENFVLKEANAHFPLEFMNRIDGSYVFHRFAEKEVNKILNIELTRAQKNIFLEDPNLRIFFILTQRAKNRLMRKGYQPEHGARGLRRVIESDVVNPLLNLRSSQNTHPGDLIQIDFSGDDLSFLKMGNLSQPSEYAAFMKAAYDVNYNPEKKRTLRQATCGPNCSQVDGEGCEEVSDSSKKIQEPKKIVIQKKSNETGNPFDPKNSIKFISMSHSEFIKLTQKDSFSQNILKCTIQVSTTEDLSQLLNTLHTTNVPDIHIQFDVTDKETLTSMLKFLDNSIDEFSTRITGFDFSKAALCFSDEHVDLIVDSFSQIITDLDLSSTRITAQGFAQLAQLVKLRFLRLAFSDSITDKEIGQLNLPELTWLDLFTMENVHGENFGTMQLPRLTHLELRSMVLSPNVLTQLNLPELTSLNLVFAEGLTNAGLGQPNLPNLTSLNLNATDLQDTDLGFLSRFENLRSLDLSHNPQVTGAGLSQLQLPNLTSLVLTRTGVNGADIGRSLLALQNLSLLNLSLLDTLTAAGLSQLQLPNLTSLKLKGSSITDSEVSDFCEKNPRIQIVR